MVNHGRGVLSSGYMILLSQARPINYSVNNYLFNDKGIRANVGGGCGGGVGVESTKRQSLRSVTQSHIRESLVLAFFAWICYSLIKRDKTTR